MSRWDDARGDDRLADPRQTGHRREFDPRHQPRQSFGERKELALTDVAVFRTVSVRDLAAARFGGHPFTTRKAINSMVRAGWMREHTAKGPKGRKFTVLTVTPKGAQRGKELAAKYGLSRQVTWSGLVKRAELRHELAVYRAVQAETAKLEARGCVVERIRIDAEMKREIARATVTRAAAMERRRAARYLRLPMRQGRVPGPRCPAPIPRPGRTHRARQRRGRLRALLRRVDFRQSRRRILYPLHRQQRSRPRRRVFHRDESQWRHGQRRQDRRQDCRRPWERRRDQALAVAAAEAAGEPGALSTYEALAGLSWDHDLRLGRRRYPRGRGAALPSHPPFA